MNESLPMHERRIVYEIHDPDSVAVHRNLVYHTVEDTNLTMDIYTPKGISEQAKLPAIVFIPGGPLRTDGQPALKDRGIFVSYGQLTAVSGLIGATFNHHYEHYSNLRQANSNVIRAISWVRKHADEFRIDRDRLCLWTFSGGGPFLSFVFKERPEYVRCLVIYYALLDLRSIKQFSNVAEDLSPVIHIDSGLNIPTFIAKAGLDRKYINQSIDLFIQKAEAINIPLEAVKHVRGHHGFDILDDDARSREIIERTIEFVKANV